MRVGDVFTSEPGCSWMFTRGRFPVTLIEDVVVCIQKMDKGAVADVGGARWPPIQVQVDRGSSAI